MKYKREFLIGWAWVVCIVIVAVYLLTQNLSLIEWIFQLYNYMRENIFTWALIFIIAFTIRPLVFIPASPFDLIAGATFWLWWGFIICLAWNITSCIFSYYIGLWTGWKLFEKISPDNTLKKMKEKIQEQPFFTISMMRLLFFPYDLTNYFCGVLKVSLVPYIVATAIAGIPAVFIFVLAGASFYGQEVTSISQLQENVNYQYLFFAMWLFLISIISSKILKKKYNF